MPQINRVPSREITPEDVFLNRRTFLRAGLIAASSVATGLVYRQLNHPGNSVVETPRLANLVTGAGSAETGTSLPGGESLTSLQSVTNYNNFYEFSTNKEAVAAASKGFVAKP